MISQTTEYALRAVVFMAQHPDDPWTTSDIAEATRVPAGYLSKVLQGLSRSGLISSQRGRHGGFQLIPDPKQLTVLQIIDAVDPLQRIHSCPLGIPSHHGGLCPLHQALDDAIAQVRETFDKTMVVDLLGKEGTLNPLCETPSIMPTISTNGNNAAAG